MSEIKIDKTKTCAVSGHRKLFTFDCKDMLYKVFLRAIDRRNIDTFLCGMALGFDTLCFHVLEEIKKEKNIKIIACVPCENQAEKWSPSSKKEYERMLKVADDVVLISKEYTPSCMFMRNRFMVDNASILIAYLTKNYGGTFFTVDYAKKKGLNIVNMAEILSRGERNN